MVSMQGYVIRTATTFDDSILRRDAKNEEVEDQISPKGAMDFPDEAAHAQKKLDRKNTSMVSMSSTSASPSLKRNLSDSQLVTHVVKSMHSWKCNLCFHDNLNTIDTTCAMCGTHMDASFMAALNALDNMKDPSVHNDEENVEDEKDCIKNGDEDQEELFPDSLPDRNNSFRTADEDTTFISFATAQQSVIMGADVSTIHPETVGTSIHGDGSMEAENESNLNASNPKNNPSSKTSSNTSGLMNISVNSSITMQNQNFSLQSTSMLDCIEVQTSDVNTSKTMIDNADDSIHTLLNVTHPEADDEFDPMLFQRDDAMDVYSLRGEQDDGGSQEVECTYETTNETTTTQIVENTNSHPFSLEKEIQLGEFIKRSQELQRQARDSSPDKFPYVPETEEEPVMNVDDNQNKRNEEEPTMNVEEKKNESQFQIEVPMGDQECMVQERESFVEQHIWRIRKTAVVVVITIVLVSVFAIS